MSSQSSSMFSDKKNDALYQLTEKDKIAVNILNKLRQSN
jgi:hypothetical protein